MAQTLTGETFYNLTINNSYATPDDTNDVDSSAAVTVSNTLTVTDGQFQPTTASSFKDISIGAAGILKPDASASVVILGDWTNSGTFTHNSGTLNFNGTSGTMSIDAGGTTAAKAFYHIEYYASANLEFTGNTQIDGNLTLLGQASLSDNDGNITVVGNVTISDMGLTLGAGTWTIGGNFNLSNATSFSATETTIILNGSTSDQTISTGNYAFNNLTLNNTASSGFDDIIISGALDINGTLTITDGDLDVTTNDVNVTTAGSVTIGANGTIDTSTTAWTGTWTFDGTAAAVFTDNNCTKQNLRSVTLNKTDTVAPGTNNKLTLASSMTVDTMTIDGTVGSADTLDLGAGGYTLTLANAGAAATVLTVNGTFTAGTSTTKYTATNSGGNITVNTGVTYSTLELDAAETFATGAGATVTATNLTLTSGTFQPSTTNTLSLSQNLALNGTSTFDETNNPAISVGADLTVASGVTWTRGTGLLTMTGLGTTPVLTDNRVTKGDLKSLTIGA